MEIKVLDGFNVEIFTDNVEETALDEAPIVYKPMQEIIDNIGEQLI